MCLGQTENKQAILVLSTHFYKSTIISITCEAFVASIEGQLKMKEICAEDSIEMLEQFLKEIKFSKKLTNIDTRAKLFFKSISGHKFEICTDGVNISIDGRLIKRNNTFLKFVLSMIPKEQQVSAKIIGLSRSSSAKQMCPLKELYHPAQPSLSKLLY